MKGIYYALMLTGACIAAMILGYAWATMTDPEHFETYNEYEAHVAELSDRRKK